MCGLGCVVGMKGVMVLICSCYAIVEVGLGGRYLFVALGFVVEGFMGLEGEGGGRGFVG